MRIITTMKLGQFALGALVVAVSAATSAPRAQAQSLTPMRGEIKSFTDKFAVRVTPGNPYQHRIKVEVRVYDENFAPVEAMVSPRETILTPQDGRTVMVMVPFNGSTQRRVRICAESIPVKEKTTRVRTQVCGRFLARRVQ